MACHCKVDKTNFVGYSNVTLFGVKSWNGALFSYSVGDMSQNCSIETVDPPLVYQAQLCSLSGLDPASTYTLVVKHIDVYGTWLNFDFLK